MAKILCSVCGNETDSSNTSCRFCESTLEVTLTDRKFVIDHRIINIEQGRPLVETALRKMENELQRAQSEHVHVATLIHGYGSSGKGGKIRTECRKVLDHLVQQKKINQVIAGEHFKRRSGSGKALLQRYPHLESNCSSDFSNPGITIVVL